MEEYSTPLSNETIIALKQFIYRLWPASNASTLLKREVALLLLEDPDQRLRISHVEALLSARLPHTGTAKHSLALQNLLSDSSDKGYFYLDPKTSEQDWGMQLLRLNAYEFAADTSFFGISSLVHFGQFSQGSEISSDSAVTLGSSPAQVLGSLAIPPSTPKSSSESPSFQGSDVPSSPVLHKFAAPEKRGALRNSFTSASPGAGLFSTSAGKSALMPMPFSSSTWSVHGSNPSSNHVIVGSFECGSDGSSLASSLRYGSGFGAGSFFPSPIVDIPAKGNEVPKEVASIWGGASDAAWAEPAVGSSWHSCGSPEMDGIRPLAEYCWKGMVTGHKISADQQDVSNGGSASSNEEADDQNSNCMDIESALEAIIELDTNDLVPPSHVAGNGNNGNGLNGIENGTSAGNTNGNINASVLALRSTSLKPGMLEMENRHYLEGFMPKATSASFSAISSHSCKQGGGQLGSGADSYNGYNVSLSWNSLSPSHTTSWSAMAAREPHRERIGSAPPGSMKQFMSIPVPPPPPQPQAMKQQTGFGITKPDPKLLSKLSIRVRVEIQNLVKQVPGLKFEDFDEGVLFQLSLKREDEALAALRTLAAEDVTGIQHMAAYINHVIKNFHLTNSGNTNALAASLPSATVRANSTPVSSKAILQKLPLRVYKKLEEIINKCGYMEWKHFDAGVVKVLAQLAEISEDDVSEELDMLKGTDLSNVEYMPAYLNKRLNNKLWSRRKMMMSPA